MKTPKYRHNKTTGRAVVTLNGNDIWLGPYGSKKSKQKYDQVVADWLQNGRQIPTTNSDGPSVSKLLAEFLKHAKTHYVKGGELTTEFEAMRRIVRVVNSMFGRTPTKDFGPKRFKAVRQKWIDKGNARQTINKDSSRLKTIFSYGVENELVPVDVSLALAKVKGLASGRSGAVEDAPDIPPVPREVVDRTLLELSQIVGDMVRLQLLIACRPGEVCALTPGQIDRSRDVWEFHFAEHKMAGKFGITGDRVIFFGPKAQAVLGKYLDRPDDAFCFSPAENLEQVRQGRNDARKTPPSCGNRRGKKSGGLAGWTVGDHYTTAKYGQAIRRACERIWPCPPPHGRREGETVKAFNERLRSNEKDKAAVMDWNTEHRWTPNQLRHLAATEIRSEYDVEAAQVILGHAHVRTTEIYAERDSEKAREIMRKVG